MGEAVKKLKFGEAIIFLLSRKSPGLKEFTPTSAKERGQPGGN
jgi:hypothetical protein